MPNKYILFNELYTFPSRMLRTDGRLGELQKLTKNLCFYVYLWGFKNAFGLSFIYYFFIAIFAPFIYSILKFTILSTLFAAKSFR